MAFHELGLYFLMHVPHDWPQRTSQASFAGVRPSWPRKAVIS